MVVRVAGSESVCQRAYAIRLSIAGAVCMCDASGVFAWRGLAGGADMLRGRIPAPSRHAASGAADLPRHSQACRRSRTSRAVRDLVSLVQMYTIFGTVICSQTQYAQQG